MDLLYELWVHDICGFDPKRVGKSMFIFKNAYNAYHSKPYSVDRIKAFGMSGFASASKSLEAAEEIAAECREKGIRIISINDEEYPELLRHAYMPPRLLFAKGELKNLNGYFSAAVVGTRHATDQGRYFTKRLCERLCRGNKVMIVSGMAEGIDAAAHYGAIKGGGKTVAVLAGGCDKIYPQSNKNLYYDILEHGAVISERPPGVAGRGYFYQQRNRIIAGMCSCTVVVEGRAKSGARITASHALDNNRDLFTVPGSPMSPQSELPNRLIKEGAEIVRDEADIINEYIEVYPQYFKTNKNDEKTSNSKKNTKASSYNELSEEERLIMEYITKSGGSASAEKMSEMLSIGVGELNAALTVLCIKDYIAQPSQDRYILKEAD